MTPKQEAGILREIERIHRDCSERVACYMRWRWIAIAISLGFTFLAFLVASSNFGRPTTWLLLALSGGLSGGVSLLFSAAARQCPLITRYTSLREEELRKRLEELSNVER
jgi:hypothetical protein